MPAVAAACTAYAYWVPAVTANSEDSHDPYPADPTVPTAWPAGSYAPVPPENVQPVMFDVKSEFVTNCADVSPAGVAEPDQPVNDVHALIVVDVGGDDDGAASDVDDKP